MADKQGRKWQLTINNPQDKGLNHRTLRLILDDLRSLEYFCMADEIGLETHTPHTHLFIVCRSPVKFSRLKKLFPEAHIERARGTAAENRAYVEKSGKWADDPKSDTSVPGTFEEWGELPNEPGQGARSDIAQLYEMIADGMSNAEIMAQNPDLALHIGKMDKIRQDILGVRPGGSWRNTVIPTSTA